jgi:hypothetical protein
MLRPPVVALVGAEYEENLSLRYLAAAVETAGLYQAELVIDCGPRGLSFDTLALEVS